MNKRVKFFITSNIGFISENRDYHHETADEIIQSDFDGWLKENDVKDIVNNIVSIGGWCYIKAI